MKNLDIIKIVMLINEQQPNSYSVMSIRYLKANRYLVKTVIDEIFVVDLDAETAVKSESHC